MTLVIAHRGASAAHPPGNTLEAFRAARPLGADWVELDVRAAADGALVVHHDPTYPDGTVVAEVAAADRPGFVPLLGEAVTACAGLGVNVEIKREPGSAWDDPALGHVDATVELLGRLAEPERFLVTSFDLGVVERVRLLDPELPTGYLTLAPTGPGDAVEIARQGGHVALNPWDGAVDAAVVDRAHAAGLAVNVWTVDDPERMAELLDLGVDGIVTNHPDVARAVVDARR